MDDVWDINTIEKLKRERENESNKDTWNRKMMNEEKEDIKKINKEINDLKKEKDRILEIIPALTSLIFSKSENEKSVAIDKLEELKVERGFRSIEDILKKQKHRLEEINKRIEKLNIDKTWREFTVSWKRMDLHGNLIPISLEEAVDKACEKDSCANRGKDN